MPTHPTAGGNCPERRLPTTFPALLALTALLCALLVGLPAPRATAAPEDSLPIEVSLEAVDPAVATPGTPLTLTGTIRNLTRDTVPVGTVRVSTAYRGLDTPATVAGWADGDLGESVDTPLVVGQDRIRADLAPGAVVSFRVVVDEGAVDPPFEFATLPLRVEATPRSGGGDAGGAEVLGGLRTFLPWDGQTGYEYHPLRVSWLLPVTVPANPDLLSADQATRDAAWRGAIGPDSAPRRLLTDLADSTITFMVDPALLSPPEPVPTLAPPEEAEEPPADTTASSPPADDTASTAGPTQDEGAATTGPPAGDDAADDAETSGEDSATDPPPSPDLPAAEAGAADHAAGLRSALAQVDPDRLWWLPVGDVDIAALLDIGLTPQEVAGLTGPRSLPGADGTGQDAGEDDGTTATDEDAATDEDSTGDGSTEPGLEGELSELLGSGRHDIAWPAMDRVTEEALAAITAVWRSHAPEPGSSPARSTLAATVLPGSSIAPHSTRLTNAVRVHTDGTALLGYHERLSALVNGADTQERAGPVTQRLIAELLARYQERPARDRSLLIALPREHGVTPEALAALYDATADLPWAQAVPLQDLLGAARTGQQTHALTAPGRETAPSAYPSPPESPLTADRIELVEATREKLAGVAQVVPDGEAGARSWDSVLDQLYSVRWRYNPDAWTEPITQAQALAQEIINGIHVNPTTINFLADEGLLQITVVNDLPVTVRDLTMTLRPLNPRLRIVEQPDPIEIGPSSRATVQFRARSLASGEVAVETALTTPDGTALADQQLMKVNVRPTGVWIYWVLGGVAGIILVLGLWRALRPQRSASGSNPAPHTTEGDGDDSADSTTEHA